ncbi:MAG TPA: response regulator, partial [Bryobacteraceae bacterium]|nr:response regulator [Bryobacteraceae bacterium]
AVFMLAENRFEPDLIVLDLNLPKLSGTSFLSRAKPKAPVVVFSSSTNVVDIRNCVELGAREFVPKPTDLEESAHRVSRIVRHWLPTDRKREEAHEVEPIPSHRRSATISLIPNRTAAQSLAVFFLSNAKGENKGEKLRSALLAVDRFFKEHLNQAQWNREMRVLVGEELEDLAGR